jgi:hypothetical protein
VNARIYSRLTIRFHDGRSQVLELGDDGIEKIAEGPDGTRRAFFPKAEGGTDWTLHLYAFEMKRDPNVKSVRRTIVKAGS